MQAKMIVKLHRLFMLLKRCLILSRAGRRHIILCLVVQMSVVIGGYYLRRSKAREL